MMVADLGVFGRYILSTLIFFTAKTPKKKIQLVLLSYVSDHEHEQVSTTDTTEDHLLDLLLPLLGHLQFDVGIEPTI